MQKIPEQFFWQIENFLQKFSEHDEKQNKRQDEKKKFLDFSQLEGKYPVETNCNLPLQYQPTPFQIKHFPDFTPSKKSVFTDEYGENFLGLKKFSLCFSSSNQPNNRNKIQKPIYFFDNHQNALIPFFDFFQKTKNPVSVVHIDAHRDDAIFPYSVETNCNFPLQEKYIHEILSKCRVSDYLDAGKKIGMIGEIFNITQSTEFENFLDSPLPKNPYILNLDIDIYGPEGSAVDTLLKTEVIAKAWKNADMVCFATSPAFIDQKFAARLGEIFFKKM